MNRRTFLAALASGGTAALAGCTSRRETLHSVTATVEIPSGEFYHEPLRVEEEGKQFNLRYEVTADDPFDVFLFGGQSTAEEFGVYRRAVRAAGERAEHRPATGADGERSASGSGKRSPAGRGNGSGGGERSERAATPGSGASTERGSADPGPEAGSGSGDGRRTRRRRDPQPSDWHSVTGTRRGEVNKPLRPGVHHFVVDNTQLGAATPTGTLRPTVDLAVRDFELFSA